jgi:DNA-binding transcriptional ArsR family regulator
MAGVPGPERADGPVPVGVGEARRVAALIDLASDPYRLGVLLLLRGGEQPVGDLVARTGCHRSSLSYHLKLLRLGGLAEIRRGGEQYFYSLTVAGRCLADTVAPLVKGE